MKNEIRAWSWDETFILLITNASISSQKRMQINSSYLASHGHYRKVKLNCLITAILSTQLSRTCICLLNSVDFRHWLSVLLVYSSSFLLTVFIGSGAYINIQAYIAPSVTRYYLLQLRHIFWWQLLLWDFRKDC